MPHYTYLMIGGGMTADAAVRGLRKVDAEGSIGLISAESHPPYNRPPLSKSLWQGKPLDTIWRETESKGVTLHLGRTAQGLDVRAKRVVDDQETVYTFDKLLLATGGRPRRLPFGDEQITYFRTLDDYRRLRNVADRKGHFAVIGGGYIGSEIAAALTQTGSEVTMIFPEQGLGAGRFPQDLALFLNRLYQEKGVTVLPGETAAGLEPRGQEVILRTGSGRELVVDAVVAGLGIEPNTELALAAGLEVDNGVVTDEFLRAGPGHPDVFAAGDGATFYNPALGKRIRAEHEDNANSMGWYAGQAMAGKLEPYDHLPFFYSDLFELGYEAVGELNARLTTLGDWRESYRKGVVYYLDGDSGRVRGVLLWNTWGKLEAARQLVAEPGPLRVEDLKGRITE